MDDHTHIESACAYWQQGRDPETVDIRLRQLRRYFRAARTLYEMQFVGKRPAAILKMKSNAFGFKNGSTVDALAALVSPLRSPQVLDHWSPQEICVFEDAIERFDKKFHLIAEQARRHLIALPRKSTRDVIAFYYIWKKHGSRAEQDEPEDDEMEDLLDPSVSIETLRRAEALQRRQHCMRNLFDAVRSLHHPSPTTEVHPDTTPLVDFGFRQPARRQPWMAPTSNLRMGSPLDTWTPWELRVFELAMECYGKQFHQIAQQIGTKSCKEVIALYYLWKNDPQYQIVKKRWGKSESRSGKKATTKKSVASKKKPAVPAT